MARISRLLAPFLLLVSLLSGVLAPFCPAAAIADAGTGSEPEPKTIRLIVILAEFPGGLHKVSRETIQQRVFTEVADYYRETSFGLVNLTGDIVPDWIMMPRPISAYGDMSGLVGSDALNKRFTLAFDLIKAADPQVDFRKYDKVVIIVPAVIPVNFSLQQPVSTNDSASITFLTVQREDMPASLIAHELGHSLGLPDLYDHMLAQYSQSSLAGAIYMGPWCLMSDGRTEQFCGFSKVELGWIGDSRMVRMVAGAQRLVSLEPLEVTGTGTKVIRIDKGSSEAFKQYYLVEARRKIGLDKDLPDEGILVTYVDEEKALRDWALSVKVSGPAGFVKLMKPDPETSLNHATFDLGAGHKNIFTDASQNLAVIILGSSPAGYDVLVTKLQGADEIADYARRLYQASAEIDKPADKVSPSAGLLIERARTERDACMNKLRSLQPDPDQQGPARITRLMEEAAAANQEYAEASADIERATQSIEQAEKDGRTGGLDQAKGQWESAGAALKAGKGGEASVAAARAIRSASASTPFPQNLIDSIVNLFKRPAPASADFVVLSASLAPQPINLGKSAAVTARIANVGQAEGVYAASVTVDGVQAARADRTIAPGRLDKVKLAFTPAKSGELAVAMGDFQQKLAVKKLVERQVELKYDNDRCQNALSFFGGHIIDFTPPASPFTVSKLRLWGRLSPKAPAGSENRRFDLQILDSNLKVLHTAAYTYDKFPATGGWVDFDVPDVDVDGRFYVLVYTGSEPGVIGVGVDRSRVNEHSDCAVRDAKGNVSIFAQWPYATATKEWFSDKKEVNWMIRATGTAQVPED